VQSVSELADGSTPSVIPFRSAAFVSPSQTKASVNCGRALHRFVQRKVRQQPVPARSSGFVVILAGGQGESVLVSPGLNGLTDSVSRISSSRAQVPNEEAS
jgi:hypothetical protein